MRTGLGHAPPRVTIDGESGGGGGRGGWGWPQGIVTRLPPLGRSRSTGGAHGKAP